MFLGTMLKIAKCDSERILQFSSVGLREKERWKLVNVVRRSFRNCSGFGKEETFEVGKCGTERFVVIVVVGLDEEER